MNADSTFAIRPQIAATIRKTVAALASLAVVAGLFVVGSSPAQAAVTWQMVDLEFDTPTPGYPGGVTVEASKFTYNFPSNSIETRACPPSSGGPGTSDPWCYQSDVSNMPGGGADGEPYVDVVFDKPVADIIIFPGMEKYQNTGPDSMKYYAATSDGSGGLIWDPINLALVADGGARVADGPAEGNPWQYPVFNWNGLGGFSCEEPGNPNARCDAYGWIQLRFDAGVLGIRSAATGVPGNGGGANGIGVSVGYDADNPPVPPAPPAPTVTEIGPVRGPVGGQQVVTIKGTNFIDGDTEITLGGVPCTDVEFVSATEVKCTTGAHAAGDVDVVVTTSDGSDTLTDGYTYVEAPAITSVSPNMGPLAGGEKITIKGTDLTGATSVTVGGDECTDLVVVDDETITCDVPAAPGGAPGEVDVVVTAPGGVETLPSGYTYVDVPTVTEVSPDKGPASGGQSVTVKGTNFVDEETEVEVGGVACAPVVVSSPTELTCTTGAHAAGPADVVVTTPGGTETVANGYTYVDAPTVTEVSPDKGPASGGQSVTVKGTNFVDGETEVEVGGVACAPVVVSSPTELTCTTGAHAAGQVDVVVTTPGGTVTLPGAYTYEAAPTPPPPPTIKKPNKPTAVKVSGSPRSSKHVVSWKSPNTAKGVRPVTSYRIKLNLIGCKSFILNKKLGKNKRSYTFTRKYLLKNGTCKRAVRGEVKAKKLRFQVRIEAFNSKGGGPVSSRKFMVIR